MKKLKTLRALALSLGLCARGSSPEALAAPAQERREPPAQERRDAPPQRQNEGEAKRGQPDGVDAPRRAGKKGSTLGDAQRGDGQPAQDEAARAQRQEERRKQAEEQKKRQDAEAQKQQEEARLREAAKKEGEQPAGQPPQDADAEAKRIAGEKEGMRREAADKQGQPGQSADAEAKRIAAEKERARLEAERSARMREAARTEQPAPQIAPALIERVKNSETVHRGRMARLDKLQAIYTEKKAETKLAELRILRERELERYQADVNAFRTELGDPTYERIKASLATPSGPGNSPNGKAPQDAGGKRLEDQEAARKQAERAKDAEVQRQREMQKQADDAKRRAAEAARKEAERAKTPPRR